MTSTKSEHGEGTSLLESRHSSSSPRWITVEPVILLFAAVASTSTLVILPQYIEQRLAEEYNVTFVKDDSDSSTCNDQNTSTNPDYKIQQKIAAETANWVMVATALRFFPALLTAPFYGALSDRVGRKLHLLIPILANLFTAMSHLIVLHKHLPIEVFVYTYLFGGLGGGYTFLMAGCYAYMSDITSGKSRLFRIAVVHAVFLGTMSLIQVPMGYLVDQYGFIPATWLCFAFLLAAISYIIIPGLLQESLVVVRPNPLAQDKIVLKKLLLDVYEFFKNNTQKRRNRLLLLLLIYFITDTIQLSQGATQIFILYGLGPPFCWSSITAGYFTFAFLGAGTLGMLIGSRLFSVCLTNFWILQIAYVFGLINYLIAALAPSTAIFILGSVIGGLRAMDTPVINTMFSTIVSPDEQGVVFAVESSVQSLGNFVSPLVLNPIYSATVETQPTAVFYVMGSGFIILFILSWIWRVYTNKITSEEDIDQQSMITKAKPFKESSDFHVDQSGSCLGADLTK